MIWGCQSHWGRGPGAAFSLTSHWSWGLLELCAPPLGAMALRAEDPEMGDWATRAGVPLLLAPSWGSASLWGDRMKASWHFRLGGPFRLGFWRREALVHKRSDRPRGGRVGSWASGWTCTPASVTAASHWQPAAGAFSSGLHDLSLEGLGPRRG